MEETIFSRKLYGINIQAPDNSIVPNDVTLPRDGFFIAYTIKDNTQNYYYVPEEDDWSYYNTSYGPMHANLAFHAHRYHLLEPFPARYHISCMLDKAEIPIDAQPPLMLKIQRTVASIANDPSYAAPKIVPILVEITTWSCRDVSDYFNLFSIPEVDMDDEITANMSSLTMEENDPRVTPAARSAIELLEKVKLDVMDDEERVCTVCFEHFLKGDEVISMPCKHLFHGECITKWLMNSNICPLCRFEMPVDPSE